MMYDFWDSDWLGFDGRGFAFVEILVRLEVWNFEETRMVLVVLVCRHWLLTLKRADIWAGVLRFMGMYLFVFDSE